MSVYPHLTTLMEVTCREEDLTVIDFFFFSERYELSLLRVLPLALPIASPTHPHTGSSQPPS